MMLADILRRLINENPVLLPYKRQLVGCCKRRASDEKIRRRVKEFLGTYPQFQDILDGIAHL